MNNKIALSVATAALTLGLEAQAVKLLPEARCPIRLPGRVSSPSRLSLKRCAGTPT